MQFEFGVRGSGTASERSWLASPLVPVLPGSAQFVERLASLVAALDISISLHDSDVISAHS